jgi:hypothetical protein
MPDAILNAAMDNRDWSTDLFSQRLSQTRPCETAIE